MQIMARRRIVTVTALLSSLFLGGGRDSAFDAAHAASTAFPFLLKGRGRARNQIALVTKLHHFDNNSKSNSAASLPLLLSFRAGATARGGASSSNNKKKSPTKGKSKKKKKARRKSKKADAAIAAAADDDGKPTKTKVSKALQEKDAATAMGDAIRSNAPKVRDLLENNNNEEEKKEYESDDPLLRSVDRTVRSVGWALGASDSDTTVRPPPSSSSAQQTDINDNDNDPDGAIMMNADVPGAPASVLVNYFLKSHGGAHALQSVFSLAAAAAGVGAVGVSLFSSTTTFQQHQIAKIILFNTLTKRCLLFAMLKHCAGLLAAAVVASSSIPEVGLRQARKWMEQLALDPVSQYVFYTACIYLWLPVLSSREPLEAVAAKMEWWQLGGGFHRWVPALLVGPVVLREVVSTAMVISDVLVLWLTTHNNSDDGDETTPALVGLVRRALSVSRATVDAAMSLVVTPTVWRGDNNDDKAGTMTVQRQAILAKIVAKVSLVLEAAVGLLLLADGVRALLETMMVGVTGRTLVSSSLPVSFVSRAGRMAKKLVICRLYVLFLWSRRQRFRRVALDLRGGAADFPMYVLSCLLHPAASMGLVTATKTTRRTTAQARAPAKSETAQQQDRDSSEILSNERNNLNWNDYVWAAFGWDEAKE